MQNFSGVLIILTWELGTWELGTWKLGTWELGTWALIILGNFLDSFLMRKELYVKAIGLYGTVYRRIGNSYWFLNEDFHKDIVHFPSYNVHFTIK